MTTDAQIISLTPAITHFEELVQGDSLSFKITLEDDAGDPINLTGTTAEMDVKRIDGTLVFTLTVGDGITFTNPTGGEMTLLVEPSETNTLDPEFTYRYDVQWTNGTTIRTLAWGTIRTLEQVTT